MEGRVFFVEVPVTGIAAAAIPVIFVFVSLGRILFAGRNGNLNNGGTYPWEAFDGRTKPSIVAECASV